MTPSFTRYDSSRRTPHPFPVYPPAFESFGLLRELLPESYIARPQPSGGASISRAISTQGYSSVTLVIYLGAKSYEGAEQLKLSWWDGATWRVLTVIRDGTARENARLNKIQIKLPAAAAGNPNFKIRIQQLNATADDFGYVDEVKLIGTPK